MTKEKMIFAKLIEDDTLRALSEIAEVDEAKVRKILAETLPQIMKGVERDANENGEAFEKALGEHAERDVSDISEFLKKSDAEDGEKILAYLLGDEKESLKKSAARKAGVTNNKTALILALCAPLLLSLLGQDGKNDDSDTSILGSLLGGSGSSGGLANLLLGSLLDGNGNHSEGGNLAGTLVATLLGGGSSSHNNGSVIENLGGELFEGLLGEDNSDSHGNSSGNIGGELLGSLLGGGSNDNGSIVESLGGELLGSLLGTKEKPGKKPKAKRKSGTAKKKSTRKR